MYGNRTRPKKAIRTLTPKYFKVNSNNKNNRKNLLDDDDDDSDKAPIKTRKTIELDRKRKRNMACDMNRPNLNDNCDDTIISEDQNCVKDSDDDDETDWIEENDNDESEARLSSKQDLDQSLDYIRQRENYSKRQHKMRRRSFNNNRRSSLISKHKFTTEITTQAVTKMSTDKSDWEKFQSCMSLKSDSFMLLPQDSFQTPKKSCSRNFVDSHIAEVNRMSDYFVNSQFRFAQNNTDDDNDWDFDFKDIKKPVPLIIISFLTLGLLAAVCYNITKHE